MTIFAKESEQFITSPKYPGNYPDKSFCSWKISSTTNLVRINLGQILIEI